MQTPLPEIKIVQKGWGFERWLFNTDRLCVKELVFKPNAYGSMHFHANKQEVFYVKCGNVQIRLLDTETCIKYTYNLKEGESMIINPLVPHQIVSKFNEGCTIIESSTHHEDSDSYRVGAGDSQL